MTPSQELATGSTARAQVRTVLPSHSRLSYLILASALSAATCAAYGVISPAIPREFPATLWERVVAQAQDPYLVIYLIWPVLLIVAFAPQSAVLSDASLLRRGALWRTVLSEAVRGGLLGAAVGAGLVAGAAVLGIGSPASSDWGAAGLASAEGNGSPLLAAYVGARIAPVAAGVSPVLSLSGATAALLALATVLCRKSRALTWALAFTLILSPPILFRVVPPATVMDPMAFLVPVRAVAAGVQQWLPALVAFGFAGVLAAGSAWWLRASWVRSAVRSPEAVWVACVLIIAILLLARAPDDATTVEALFFGASVDGTSLTYWAFAVVVWQGLAFLLLMRWSSWVMPRFPLLALRYGSAWRVVGRSLRQHAAQVAMACIGIVAAAVVMGAVAGLSAGAVQDWIVVLAGGAATTLGTVTVALTMVWLLQRQVWSVVILSVSVALSLPPLNPLWPWPTGAGMWGAWGNGTVAALCILQVPIAFLVLLAVAWKKPRPEVIDA